MKTCVFPGSFDPVTLGHLDLISRAAKCFDRVTVTLMVNISKQGRLDPETRIRLLEDACAGMENVAVDRWNGLLADYMARNGETTVIRGVRSVAEFEAEITAAEINRKLNPAVETMLLPASAGYAGLSSTTVWEIASFGGEISSFVTEKTAEEIRRRMSK